jgi:leucyl-tRNA synthetase
MLEGGAEVTIGSIEKMSKSKRNVVDPDDIIETFGADTARWFMLSDSPPERDVIWSEEGVQGASRYVQQLWRLVGEIAGIAAPVGSAAPAAMCDKAVPIRRLTHGHLLRVQENIERLRFNTAIAEIRKLSNALSDAIGEVEEGGVDAGLAFAFREGGDVLVNLFAPMMPHLAEECWAALGHSTAIAEAAWPLADAALATNDTVTLPIQINGKKRAEITVDRSSDNATVAAAVLALDAVQKALEGRTPKKIIVVPQRIVNVVA